MKKLVALFVLALYSSFSFACSTFLLNKNGHLVFGRNYDWVSGNGMVVVNARGLKKSSFAVEGAKKISWISKHGSISFNQFGKEFPHGGMNEKGLVVELMWLTGTEYPKADERAALNELQWIQYQLDNCATVNDVLATDKLIRIGRDGAAPLHYLIADANGIAATVEFINGKMVVHNGKQLKYPVLTNTVYEEALRNTALKYRRDNSVDRFATACNMLQQYQQSNSNQAPVDYAFKMLNNIGQGSYTKWSIVYDITHKEVHFITSDHNQRKRVWLNELDFGCNSTPAFFDLSSSKSGSLFRHFRPLTATENRKILYQSARESSSQIMIPELVLNGAAAYFSSVKCNK